MTSCICFITILLLSLILQVHLCLTGASNHKQGSLEQHMKCLPWKYPILFAHHNQKLWGIKKRPPRVDGGSVNLYIFSVNLHLNTICCFFRREEILNSQLIILKAADLHQNLSNVSYFGNQNLMYLDCSLIILLFIYLDEELVWTECCGALQLVRRGSSHLQFCTFSLESSVIAVGIYVFCQFTRWLPRLCFPHVSLFRRKARLVCTIGTSPFSMR